MDKEIDVFYASSNNYRDQHASEALQALLRFVGVPDNKSR